MGSEGVRTLLDLALREKASVERVAVDGAAPEWAGWLAEIGFLPGESVHVVAWGPFGGDPIVVRVGDSTFALRRAEAVCVQVRALTGQPQVPQEQAA
jgi:ferrous iron transport protein A